MIRPAILALCVTIWAGAASSEPVEYSCLADLHCSDLDCYPLDMEFSVVVSPQKQNVTLGLTDGSVILPLVPRTEWVEGGADRAVSKFNEAGISWPMMLRFFESSEAIPRFSLYDPATPVGQNYQGICPSRTVLT